MPTALRRAGMSRRAPLRTEGETLRHGMPWAFSPSPRTTLAVLLSGPCPRLVTVPAGTLFYLLHRLSLQFDKTMTVSELPHTPP